MGTNVLILVLRSDAMNKYKINYSVTIEAETQQDAVNIFFESVPQDGEMLQCVELPPKIGVDLRERMGVKDKFRL